MSAKNITYYRKRAGLTQGQLSKETGISRTYISLIENEHLKITPSMYDKISKALGVSVDVLREPFESPTYILIQNLIEMTENGILSWTLEDASAHDDFFTYLFESEYNLVIEYIMNENFFMASAGEDIYILAEGKKLDSPDIDIHLIHAEKAPAEYLSDCKHYRYYQTITNSHKFDDLFNLHALVASLNPNYSESDIRVVGLIERLNKLRREHDDAQED